jgi:hypothetical protein
MAGITFQRPRRAAQPQASPFVSAAEFDPSQPASSMYMPEARLAELSQRVRQNPGRSLRNGNGKTGIRAGGIVGARQHSAMLREQQEHLALTNALGGKQQAQVSFEPQQVVAQDQATGRDNSAAFTYGLPASTSGAALEGIIASINKRRR